MCQKAFRVYVIYKTPVHHRERRRGQAMEGPHGRFLSGMPVYNARVRAAAHLLRVAGLSEGHRWPLRAPGQAPAEQEVSVAGEDEPRGHPEAA